MIHAYDEYYLDMAQSKLGCMFEIAFYEYQLTVDQFAEKFLASPISKAIGEADPVFLAGKSASELLALVLEIEPKWVELNQAASPEYWVGWSLAYVQWYLNRPFSVIIQAYPCGKLLLDYFPYHEMDVTKTLELFQKHLPQENPLKAWRKKRRLSQTDLALISHVPLRSIKAYEQGKLDLSKAQGETLYKLARALYCKMEDFIQ